MVTPPVPSLHICEDCPITNCAGCPVSESPDRYRKAEKREKWKVAGFVAVIFGLALFLGGTTVVIWQTHQVLISHNAELAQIKSIDLAIAKSQKNHTATLEEIAALTKEATIDKGAIDSGTAEGLADYQAICNSIPGCKLPYPTP